MKQLKMEQTATESLNQVIGSLSEEKKVLRQKVDELTTMLQESKKDA
jgi:hypothetical protein